MAAPLIEVTGVERVRGSAAQPFRLVVEHLAIRAGERLALLGPSGCGKSTCLDLLAMTLRPSRAQRFTLQPGDETPLDVAAAWEIGARSSLTRARARHVGYVLQTGGLLPFLSVLDNVLVARRLLGLACPGPARDLLRVLGIDALAARKPASVSIGERQRVAVARALAHQPRIVLADEPTASLDRANAEAVMRLLVRLADELKVALVVVSHDRELVARAGLRTLECVVEPHATVVRDAG